MLRQNITDLSLRVFDIDVASRFAGKGSFLNEACIVECCYG